MNETLEVRWFYDGPPPPSVVDWFLTLDPYEESDREDRYLIADDPSLNVKLREGKIQLKRRSDTPAPIRFSKQVAGRRESWQKWSFPLTNDAPDLFSDDPSGLWLPVHKVRLQRSYGPSEQHALLDAPPPSGEAEALVELTRVRSRSHEAWSICMEAEGPHEALPATLDRMGRFIFQQGTPPPLDDAHSYGYVQWLEQCYAPLDPATK